MRGIQNCQTTLKKNNVEGLTLPKGLRQCGMCTSGLESRWHLRILLAMARGFQSPRPHADLPFYPLQNYSVDSLDYYHVAQHRAGTSRKVLSG